MTFKPMLAAEADLATLRFPVYATPKLDGVRALVMKDGVYSRSLKLIPNAKVQRVFGHCLQGLDGELIVGSPTAPDVYRRTQSVVARAASEEEVTFHVFDKFDDPRVYEARMDAVEDVIDESFNFRLIRVPQRHCTNMDELLAAEQEFLTLGYEGLILRAPDGRYKNGRSTAKEQGMLKLKRFADSEAEIIGIEEEMENRNEAKTNALGHTERSSHKENLVGKARMGALIVRDVKTGVEFKIGTGFDACERTTFWNIRDNGLIGRVVKYKHFAIGAKDKPRFPTYVGLRDKWDR